MLAAQCHNTHLVKENGGEGMAEGGKKKKNQQLLQIFEFEFEPAH